MECGQLDCEKEATHRLFWPGKDPAPSCEEHKELGVTLSLAMGFSLFVDDLPDDEPTSTDKDG